MISIDLSDNDLTDIASVCTRLRTLPQLRNLNLKGNPICLLPSYNETCRDTLPDLHYFDGRVRVYLLDLAELWPKIER